MPPHVGTAGPDLAERPTSADVPARPSPPANGVATQPAPPSPRPAAPPVPPGRSEGADSASWLPALGVLIIGMFMSILDTSIVNVALPTVQTELGIAATDGQWVSTAYSLAEGVMVPISAWLGYRYRPKKIYLLCLAGFTVASALCGLAGGLESLVAVRILQAIRAGSFPSPAW